MYVYKSMYIYTPTLETALHPLCSWSGYGPAEKEVTEELSHHPPLGESALNDIISTLHRLCFSINLFALFPSTHLLHKEFHNTVLFSVSVHRNFVKV